MKIKFAFFLWACLICVSRIYSQTSGGDTSGYQWANNFDPLGPVYKWKDIKSPARLVAGLRDDNSTGPINIGFQFNYYGVDQDSIWIGSNGWISFSTLGNITAPFLPIPSPASPNVFVAGLLSDMTLIASNDSAVPGAAVYWWSNYVDSVIIQYDSVPFWDTAPPGYSGRNTFQIILSKAWNSNMITLQYKKLINSTPPYDLINTGLKTGIQDSSYIGLQVLSDTFPPDSSVVTFYSHHTLSTNDLANTGISLGQNLPNPSRDLTIINYSIKERGNVRLLVQNIIGEPIENFAFGNKPAGEHSISLDTRSYPSGIYFYTLFVNEASFTRKMIVAK